MALSRINNPSLAPKGTSLTGITAFGSGALNGLTTGTNNTAVGYQAGYATTTPSNAVSAFGFQAMLSNTTGTGTAVGSNAYRSNTTGTAGTAAGLNALYNNTTGNNNTAVGQEALVSNTTGSNNTAIGYQASYSLVTNSFTTTVGYFAGKTATEGYVTAVGYNAASAATTGFSTLCAIGVNALCLNTTGIDNTAVGSYSPLGSNTTGAYNTAVGREALALNTTGSTNVAIGRTCFYNNTTASNNTGIGHEAGFSNTTGANNTALGQQALRSNTTASNNTAVGYQAGYTGTTAAGNTYVGNQAGYFTTTGANNTYIGNNAGVNMTTGSKNTIVGIYSGNQGSLDIRTSSNYIVLSDGDGNPRGYFDNTGYMYVPAGINATGSGATIAGVGATNTMNGGPGTGAWALGIQQNTTSGGGGRVLGLRNVTDFNNASNEVIYYQGNATARFYVLSNGGIYNYSGNNSNLSDRREKTNFAPSKSYLDTVCAIPVQTFNYIDQNMEEDGGLTLGVVAQDVQAVAPELVKESNWGTQDEPKMRLSIYQTDLQFALMKAIQELKAEFDAYKSTHP